MRTHKDNEFARINSKRGLDGFTIIELMIATVVFGIILLMTLGGFLQIGRTFYKGITISRTENTTRTIADSLSSDIRASQYSGSTDTKISPTNVSYFCIGSHIYYFKRGVIFDTDSSSKNVPKNGYGLLRGDVGSACTNPTTAPLPTNVQELLGERMRVSNLSVQCSTTASNRLCEVSIHIAYGDNDLLDSAKVRATIPRATDAQLSAGDDVLCKGATAGTQFCATADINTSVLRGGDI